MSLFGTASANRFQTVNIFRGQATHSAMRRVYKSMLWSQIPCIISKVTIRRIFRKFRIKKINWLYEILAENRQERTSKLQHQLFLDFLEDNRDFDPRQHVASKYMVKWREIVSKLNTVGPIRNINTWVYILHSWRNQIKSKAKKISLDPACGLLLSGTEQRALNVFENIIFLSNGILSTNSDSMETDGTYSCCILLRKKYSSFGWFTSFLLIAPPTMPDVQIKQEIDSDEDKVKGLNNVIDRVDSSNGNHAEYESDANGNDEAANKVDLDQVRQNGDASHAVADADVVIPPKRLRIVNHTSASGRVYPVGIQVAAKSEGMKITCKQPEKLLRPQRLAAMRQLPIQDVQQRGQVRISRVSVGLPQGNPALRTRNQQQTQQQQQPQQQSPKLHTLPTPQPIRPQMRTTPQGGQTTQANRKVNFFYVSITI